jgi:pyridoxine/pyridoxamine 5'-phosphate oxidase
VTNSDLYQFIQKNKLGVLASVSAGTPQSALVGIAVTPRLEIIFDTVQNSRKYRNLTSNGTCSLVIGWSGEQTLQYEGTAKELKPPELERNQAIYFLSHPDGPLRMNWPGISYFLIRPKWIRYSDFDQDPAVIDEFTF